MQADKHWDQSFVDSLVEGADTVSLNSALSDVADAFRGVIVGFMNWRKMRRRSQSLLQKYKLDIRSDTQVRRLTPGQRAIVGLMRATALRIHLPTMDNRARTIHHRANPPNAGTEHLDPRNPRDPLWNNPDVVANSLRPPPEFLPQFYWINNLADPTVIEYYASEAYFEATYSRIKITKPIELTYSSPPPRLTSSPSNKRGRNPRWT